MTKTKIIKEVVGKDGRTEIVEDEELDEAMFGPDLGNISRLSRSCQEQSGSVGARSVPIYQLGVPVAFTPTGVKHLHHRAVQFPIGVYFEANGHGTVVFDEKTQALIRSKGGAKLNALMDVINQTVGDAISDMLLVECVLADRDWDCEQWFNCYKDLPNRLGKVAVRDRAMVTTTDAERKVVTPEKLQPGIDAIVAKFSQGRSFVRPRCAMKS